MKKITGELFDGVLKEWGMIVALVLLAMPPMLFHSVFFGGLHSGFVNGFDMELWRQLKYPIIDMGLLMLLVLVVVEIVHWIGKKWVKWVVYGFAVALATVRIWLWWVFRLRITPMALTLLLETNGRESSEFVHLYLFGWYGVGLVGIVVGLIGICYLFEWIDKRVELNGVWKKIALCLSIACLVWGMIEMRWMVRLLNCDVTEDIVSWQNEACYEELSFGSSNVFALLYSIVNVKCIGNDVKQCGITAYNVQKRKSEVLCQNDSLVVAFVLGESYCKLHSSLYGYGRATSPLLNEEKEGGNLYVFNDIVSSYTYTSKVLKSIFFIDEEESQPWYKYAFFPQLFRMAEFEVDLWSNQQDAPNMSAFAANDIVSVMYNKHIKTLSYTNISDFDCGYDEDLVADYRKKIFDLNCNRLMIFHLMGQHMDVPDRFPHTAENMVFKGTDGRSAKIAMYDNACVYNDKVVAEIIDMVRDKKSVVVYFSDHGEEVYDYRDCYGRKAAEPGMEKEFLKYQAEVPFMIWCSDKYKEAYPEIIEDIKSSVDKPFITDNVCQVMFHLAGLKSPWCKEERDLLSDKYKCGRRIVNGIYDYDEIMGRK